MALSFTAQYSDGFSEEDIVFCLSDDGSHLRVSIRNIEFVSDSFANLRPVIPVEDKVMVQFHLCDGVLHRLALRCEIPIEIVKQGETQVAWLTGIVRVTARDEEFPDDDYLKLSLSFNNQLMESGGDDSGFQWELEDIQKQLPAKVYLRCCFTCRYSDYNPFCGSGMMGELACFVNSPSTFKDAADRGKGFAGWRINDTTRRFAYTHVQEWHLCHEFELDK